MAQCREFKKNTGDYMSRAKKPSRPEWSADEREAAFEAVLDAMAEGTTLEEAVKALERPVTAGAMRKWIAADEGWVARYTRAKRLLAQAWAEEAVRIARDSTTSSTAIDRVLIDTLKWAAAKANPAEYGERQTVEHQGAQTLSVKIVEDDMPVRNADALAVVRAVEQAVMLPTHEFIALKS